MTSLATTFANPSAVTPAKAGVHCTGSAGCGLDSGLRRNDGVVSEMAGVEM